MAADDRLGAPVHALCRDYSGGRRIGEELQAALRALELLDRLGPHRLDVRLSGDGAGSLVEAIAARTDDGTVGFLAWNGTLDQSKAGGDEALTRRVTTRVHGLDATAYELRHFRVDADHSNVTGTWERISGGAAWPGEAQWDELVQADRLDELESPRTVRPADGVITVDFDLPMPGISFLEFSPEHSSR